MLPQSFNRWPTITLFVALALSSTAAFFYSPTSDAIFCSADDKVLALCFRNWINAAGNLITVVIATSAAFFAFGQWQSSKKQVSAAVLPALEQRLLHISILQNKCNSVTIDFYNFINLIIQMRSLISETSHFYGIENYHKEFLQIKSLLESNRRILGDALDDVKIDNDLIEISRYIWRLSSINSNDKLIDFLRLMDRVEDNMNKIFIERNAGNILRNDVGCFDITIQNLLLIREDMLANDKHFIELADAVKDKRLAVLALDDPPVHRRSVM